MSFLMNKTLIDFNSVLASSEPAPGGGSTAALSGVLGSALTMMVVNLSIGKKSYEALEESIKSGIQKDFELVRSLNEELVKLVDEDTNAFNKVMVAMKMPKETEQEKLLRVAAIEKASIYALEIPLLTAEKCLSILQHQPQIAKYGNKNAASDIGVGASLALAGLEGAILNVKINIPGIQDENIKKTAAEKIAVFLEQGKKLKEEMLEIVTSRIDG